MIRCQHLQWGPSGQPLTPPLDLQLPSGSLTGLIGSNGCGKSSLLKVIAGLQQPLRGRLELGVPRLGGVAYLVQQQALDRQFPISLQSLVSAGFWRSPLNRRERQARLCQVLDDWGLYGLQRQSLQALSGGELQRALLARLSLTEARVLLLDEPEAALDDHGQALLWQHIQRWQAEGRTQLLVSHDLASLGRRLDHPLQVSRSGCRFAPIRQLIGQRPPLEQVA
ncbi:metal ABC transporter ATP-binding protein [Pseudomonas borbori]|uniref:Zinc/manganese transport system ATP-binding protein n=1 Tax=Pseudomonas borbori TaxID=289003 RepID=A0A1I5R7H4_9PSED|nr:ATP-binding cassette domain-containing protein [Pseudomonas borbori]SFP54463.1 zinc/manganese transport system ATP-binding protein [Pseudomonas borbori]